MRLKSHFYDADPGQADDRCGECDSQGYCWFIRFGNQQGRTDIGFHPDGRTTGTAGCIGIEPINDTRPYRNIIDGIFARYETLRVEVGQ